MADILGPAPQFAAVVRIIGKKRRTRVMDPCNDISALGQRLGQPRLGHCSAHDAVGQDDQGVFTIHGAGVFDGLNPLPNFVALHGLDPFGVSCGIPHKTVQSAAALGVLDSFMNVILVFCDGSKI